MVNPTHWKHFQNQHKYLKHVLHLKCTAARIWMKEHVNYIFLVWIRPKSSARHENTSISHLSTAFWTLWFQRQSTRAIDTALETSSIVANSSASKLHSPFVVALSLPEMLIGWSAYHVFYWPAMPFRFWENLSWSWLFCCVGDETTRGPIVRCQFISHDVDNDLSRMQTSSRSGHKLGSLCEPRTVS